MRFTRLITCGDSFLAVRGKLVHQVVAGQVLVAFSFVDKT